MRRASLQRLTVSLVLLAACGLSGCAGESPVETADPGLEGLIDAGKADDPVAALYHGRARVSSAGIVTAELGRRYGDTLAYELPAEGVSLVDAWIDGTPDLGIPDGSYTELGVYRVHKTAEQYGHLYIEGAEELALHLIRRRVGGSATVSAYVNRRSPIDIGRPDVAVDYVVLVGPGGRPRGEGSTGFSALRFRIHD